MATGKLLTLREAAERTGFRESTWRSWVLRRRVPYHKVNRSVRIAEADLERSNSNRRAFRQERHAMRIPKIKPASLRCLESPLRTRYGLPRHVRKLLGEEVTEFLLGKRIGDWLAVHFPEDKPKVLFRCRGCGSWWQRLDSGCDWCESWAERVIQMKTEERDSKRCAKSSRKRGVR